MQKSSNGTAFDRKAILVLGMHRSGTSILTRVLSLLGCALPLNLMPASPTNQTGYWESTLVKKLNNRVLSAAGTYWYDWHAIPSGWLKQSTAIARFCKDGRKLFDKEFGKSDLVILKDPRIARIAPLWMSILEQAGVTPSFVLALRNPKEITASLESRNSIPPAVTYLSWLHHLLQAEFDTRGHHRVVVGYENLLNDWAKEVGRVEDCLDIVWPHRVEKIRGEVDPLLSPKLRHFQESDLDFLDDTSISSWVRDAYKILKRWSISGEDDADFHKLDAIRRSLSEAEVTFGSITTALHTTKKKMAAEQSAAAAILEKTTVRMEKLEELYLGAVAGPVNSDVTAQEYAGELRNLRRKVKTLEWELQAKRLNKDDIEESNTKRSAFLTSITGD